MGTSEGGREPDLVGWFLLILWAYLAWSLILRKLC